MDVAPAPACAFAFAFFMATITFHRFTFGRFGRVCCMLLVCVLYLAYGAYITAECCELCPRPLPCRAVLSGVCGNWRLADCRWCVPSKYENVVWKCLKSTQAFQAQMLNTPIKVQWHKTTTLICFKPANICAFFTFSVAMQIICKNTKYAIYAKLSQSCARSAIASTVHLSIVTRNDNCYRRTAEQRPLWIACVCMCALWIVVAEQGVAAASTFAYHKMACEQQQKHRNSNCCGREGQGSK